MKKLLLVFVLLFAFSSFAQGEDLEVLNQTSYKEKSKLGKIWETLWGDPTETSITAMPIGLHTDLERFKNRSVPNGLHPALYFAGNYKNVELALFKNSFGDLSGALNYKRTWNLTKRFSVNFGAGLIYGYFGRLQHSKGVPFRNTFLIKGDVMPVIGGEFDYRFYKKWSIHMGIAPAIIIYGFRYRI